MVLVAALENNGNSKVVISHNKNGGTNPYPYLRKSRSQTSMSTLSIFGLLIGLFIIGMVSTMFYTHYIILHHGDNSSYHGKHPFLSLPKSSASSKYDTFLTCDREYQRIMSNMTTNLTVDDYDRSIAHVGNRYRLSRIIQQKLLVSESTPQRQPLTIVVCGGSITLGHGITPVTSRYSNQLEVYLNTVYPTKQQSSHKVYNRGSHGADVRIQRIHKAPSKISSLSRKCLCFHPNFPVDVCHGKTHELSRYTN
jgi:hypothetical protein